jgi:hypothetical protein
MPLGIFLLWPSLHLMYGLTEHRSNRIDSKRRYSGRIVLIISLLFMNQPFGLEKGIFYWLFALMAIALCFVQLRLWQPEVVKIITALSIIGFFTAGTFHVFN